jgi:hypothetical protein
MEGLLSLLLFAGLFFLMMRLVPPRAQRGCFRRAW